MGRESGRVAIGEGEGNDERGGATERHHAYLQSDDVIEDRFIYLFIYYTSKYMQHKKVKATNAVKMH